MESLSSKSEAQAAQMNIKLLQASQEKEDALLTQYDLVLIRSGYEAARAWLVALPNEDFDIALKAISVRAVRA